ncbi:MAG TPA: helix-turn-helix domain-containing protein [Solirubrobacteraceae bacterium]|nr:helix-turn-helix domain-containing protein [Solirubrobacteraceae bacterium]
MAVSAPSRAVPRRIRRPDQLSGGRHGLSADEVRASQRARILRAMTAAVGEHGYHGVRVADVVWRAGVSRKTFYELFGGKDECFDAAYGLWIERLLATTFDAFDSQAEWVSRLRAALTALLGALAREPDGARLCFCEAVAAGGATQERRERAARELARLFDAPGTPDGPLGETLRAGRVSELGETLRRELAAGRAAELPALAPELMCAMVLPFLGMDAAQRELARGAALAG